MITNAYVDAFNLYFRCLKDTPHKWLDLRKLCELLLPKNRIATINYFTAVTIEVWKTEEKGSDVNLATQLLVDGFQGKYESAVVVSNDSDLKAPISAVRATLGMPVGVIVPGAERQIRRSALPADFYRRIRTGILAASHLPSQVRDETGVILKPSGW